MFTHHRGRLGDITPRVLFHWFLLSFMAGSINAGGFLACGRFVTHVTGTSTMVGIDFANGNYASGFGMLAIPLFFLFGVMVSAYLVDRRLTEGRSPQYPLVMGLVAGCLLFVSLRGHGNFFGNFGEMAHLRKELLFMALLSIASGLTNAAITTSTGAFVRITHLTGITTDLGIGLVRVLNMAPSDADYRTERIANICRAGNFLFFTAGAIVGALLFVRVDYLGFLLPTALALYAMGLALKSHPLRRVSKA
ncbi:MAG: DUF1275 domain-containing protein [Bdellovibrionales bacterium]|nr:DUF1275 domain-containing protein [Bdellovibrionales bacterium]